MTIWAEPHKANKNENITVFAYRKAPRLILHAFHLYPYVNILVDYCLSCTLPAFLSNISC